MSYRRNLPLLLLSVRELVRSHFQPTLREFGITEQQWRILRLLNERPGLGITEIADTCLIFRPSIVGIITRMEELGMVRRSQVASDKRRSSISLTDRGADIAARILPIFEAVYHDLEEVLGKPKLDKLYEMLDDLNAQLGAHAEAENIKGATGKRAIVVNNH